MGSAKKARPQERPTWLTSALVAGAAVGCVVAIVVAIAVLGGDGGTSSGPTQASTDGAAIYAARCASCHGADGGGGVGPKLAGGEVVRIFPDADTEAAIVGSGLGVMPVFKDILTPAEIAAVVAYTRAL